jgi:hypothetical protein
MATTGTGEDARTDRYSWELENHPRTPDRGWRDGVKMTMSAGGHEFIISDILSIDLRPTIHGQGSVVITTKGGVETISEQQVTPADYKWGAEGWLKGESRFWSYWYFPRYPIDETDGRKKGLYELSNMMFINHNNIDTVTHRRLQIPETGEWAEVVDINMHGGRHRIRVRADQGWANLHRQGFESMRDMNDQSHISAKRPMSSAQRAAVSATLSTQK